MSAREINERALNCAHSANGLQALFWDLKNNLLARVQP